MYFTYILRCADNSLYTGITTNVIRRFAQHRGEQPGGAKYTKSRFPVRVERVWTSESRSDASKLEYRIKKLSKSDKEKLVIHPECLTNLMGDKLDVEPYSLLEVSTMIKEKILELKDEQWGFLGEVNYDMTLEMFGLFWGNDSPEIKYAVNGLFEELDETGVCISPEIYCSFGDDIYDFDDDPELTDFIYKQLNTSDGFAKFRHEYEKIQYDGITSYFLEKIKGHEFIRLEQSEVEAEDGIALKFNCLLDSGLSISGLIYEIEDEYRNSTISFFYDDFLCMTLDDYNYFVEDPYLKDYIVSMLENVDFTC